MPLAWSVGQRKVDDLVPYDKNPRTLSDKQLEDLKRSFKKFNLVEIPAVDTDNHIIAGHQRLKVMQILGRGQEIIDVRIPNRKLTESEFKQYLLTSNAVQGDWDYEKLKDFDIDLLMDIGFGEDELSNIWDKSLEAEDDGFEIEKEIAKIVEPITKPGDLIQLGPHRLICGDAHDPVVIKKLFGDHKASMIYSDPIYNIGVDYNGGIGGKQNYGGKVNDKKSDSDYKEFLRQGLVNAFSVTKADCHAFYWCDEKYIWLIQQLYAELGIENKRVCLWIKNGQNPTPGVAFNKCFEACVYGVKGKPYLSKNLPNLNEVMNKEIGNGNRLIDDVLDILNIWLVKRLAGNDYEHATSKPPTLHEKAIRRCTKPGDIILDSYLGSGSTLIAAEQLKRRVYGVEIEPVFCDLIIKRYEIITNQKAARIN